MKKFFIFLLFFVNLYANIEQETFDKWLDTAVSNDSNLLYKMKEREFVEQSLNKVSNSYNLLPTFDNQDLIYARNLSSNKKINIYSNKEFNKKQKLVIIIDPFCPHCIQKIQNLDIFESKFDVYLVNFSLFPDSNLVNDYLSQLDNEKYKKFFKNIYISKTHFKNIISPNIVEKTKYLNSYFSTNKKINIDKRNQIDSYLKQKYNLTGTPKFLKLN